MIADIGLTFAGSSCWLLLVLSCIYTVALEVIIAARICISGARNILKADLSVRKQKEIYILNTT